MQASADNISRIIFIITCIFLLAGVFLLMYVWLYNKRKRRHIEEKINLQRDYEDQLLKSRIEVQEATYALLGKELHDNVGQLLGTAKILLNITEGKLNLIPESLITARQTIGMAIQEIRSLAKILSAEWLQQFSFNENLVSEVRRINTAELIQVTVRNELHYLPLNSEEQVILFRIVQEALQNALKHSEATFVNINLSLKANLLSVRMVDNGKGFERSLTKPQGTGLLNMEHRVHLLGGSIRWQPSLDGGTIIDINLPITGNNIL